MDKRLCFITNIIPQYRKPIYQLIDKEWETDWYSGRNTTDIKSISNDVLKNVFWVDNKRLFGNWYWQKGIAKAITNSQYSDYIITGDLYSLSTWWMLILRKLFYPNKKVYLWSHGWYGRESRPKKWLKRFFFGMADNVLTYSNYSRKKGIEQGFKESKITPIHNSLDHSRQAEIRKQLSPSDIYHEHFSNTNPTLIFIGRLTSVKRLDLLLTALNNLKQKGHNYNLVLIGGGEEKENLEKICSQLGLNESVWFYGPCYDEAENAQLIYNADLCVAPGNVGLTSMHVMVYGTPLLTHNDFKWQMPEFEAVIPGKTGEFFKRNNVESLADGIQKWMERHQHERDNIRQACYEEIDTNWTPEFQINVLKSLI